MEKIKDIESAVSKLSPAKLAAFRRWFEKFDAQQWDEQFEKDVQSGTLTGVAEKAIKDYKKGKSKEL